MQTGSLQKMERQIGDCVIIDIIKRKVGTFNDGVDLVIRYATWRIKTGKNKHAD